MTASDARPEAQRAIDPRPGFDVSRNRAFQGRWWRVQRIATAVLALAILAALFGLFGRGLFSRATIERPVDGYIVRYERVARVRAPLTLELELQAVTMRESTASVRLDLRTLRHFAIERVVPQPKDVVATAEGLEYRFETDAARAPAHVTFFLKPAGAGMVWTELQIGQAPPTRFRQIILP